MKTIADDPELTVSFGNEAPQLNGHKARLPQVSSAASEHDIAVTRGLADSFSLRLSNHSDKIHHHYQPQGKNARAMFEAVEQARIEALGSNAMPGMASNLTAALEDRFSKSVVNRSSQPARHSAGRGRSPHRARTAHRCSPACQCKDVCRSLAQLGGRQGRNAP